MAHHPDDLSCTLSLPFRNHTALLLATALPFLQPAYRHPIELVTKFLEFSETIKLYQEFHTKDGNPFSTFFHDVSRIGKEEGIFGVINTFITDVEGLLCNLAKVSTGDEKEIIGMFLNFIRAKNFYETYGDLMNLGSMFSQEASPSPSSESFDSSPQQDESPFPGDLSSMLNEEQQNTLNLLKSLFSAD